MKLLLCPHCQDVRKLPHASGHVLPPEEMQARGRCSCGRSWGYYTNDVDAVYSRDAVMLGFSNPSLVRAMHDQNSMGDREPARFGFTPGREFIAFIIPDRAPSVRRQESLPGPSIGPNKPSAGVLPRSELGGLLQRLNLATSSSDIEHLLGEFFATHEGSLHWWTTPHPELAGLAPRDAADTADGAVKVRDLLVNLKREVGS